MFHFIVGGMFYTVWGFYLEGVWLWRISGSYSQEMMGRRWWGCHCQEY